MDPPCVSVSNVTLPCTKIVVPPTITLVPPVSVTVSRARNVGFVS